MIERTDQQTLEEWVEEKLLQARVDWNDIATNTHESGKMLAFAQVIREIKRRQKQKAWDGESDFPCPQCGENVPYSEGMEVATVGSLFGNPLPHVNCPGCNECCGCSLG